MTTCKEFRHAFVGEALTLPILRTTRPVLPSKMLLDTQTLEKTDGMR